MDQGRLIPAHAGKTSARAYQRACCAAHPRSRGENTSQAASVSRSIGSSPLTRGKLTRRGRHARPIRLIPAHAGKTFTPTQWVTKLKAHPRSRGENDHVDCPADHELGSSPLTRGKPLIGVPAADPLGLIPAHAGKTRRIITALKCSAAHPRSRGENLNAVAGGNKETGSSPLTRGKLGPRGPYGHWRGLIPAHAGKTPLRRRRQGLGAAHPRSRGENSSMRPQTGRTPGSSPLTRGKLTTFEAYAAVDRLIPAHAGKTTRG